jgi:hypothetical protein
MTQKEIYRINIIQQVNDRLITQVKASEILKVTDRQIRNLLKIYQNEGIKGFVSKKRGRKSNRAFSCKFEARIISIISEKYDDFGPTFAKEKLLENHNIKISIETLRKLLIKHHLHVPREKNSKVHKSRPRRENFGELIQIDASIHDWLEGRGEKCALIVFIDDATSLVTSMRFHQSECLEAYFKALHQHLVKYGIPLGIYSDRHAIFGGSDRIHKAQLVRAFKELGIESILARSAQAKGRVERVNRTLQDRLIKEMRLCGISSIEEANAFLKEYLEVHNLKFSKEPRGEIDTHRPLADHDLNYILARREERTVSNSLSISFHNKKIQILEQNMTNRLKKKKVSVIERLDGSIEVYYQNRLLKSGLAEQIINERKSLDYKEKILWRPSQLKSRNDHPWKKFGYQIALSNQIKKMERSVI